MSRISLLTLFLFLLTAVSAAPQPLPADHAPDFVPLGAYLSWERTEACATYYGIDRWDDVAKRIDALAANNVNLLWVTNLSEGDLPRLLSECERRDIRLLPNIDAVEARVDWRWAVGSDYYDQLLPRLVVAAGDSTILTGWVLSDEPSEAQLPRLDTLRLKFRDLDPNRFCTAVTMWPQAPLVPVQTKLPVVCVDLYPFFGPKDPNGPHTDATSTGFFRSNAALMIEAIGDGPAVGWVMGMCFNDIWGPRKYDEQGHLIGLPGSYLHWRAPTLAEIRWQVWESFRSGAKGFISYTLAPEAPDPATATLPPADVAWKDVLATEPTDLGPNALTNPDGSITPQLEELGRVYSQLAPHTALLRRLVRSEEAFVEVVEGPASVQGFADPETGERYVFAVNDDLRETRESVLYFGESVSFVADVIRRKDLTLNESHSPDRSSFSIMLVAGDGALLGIR